MAVSVHTIDLAQEREVVVDILARNRSARSRGFYEKCFEWKYLRNPDGPATGWIVRDEGSGRAVGFTAALPRRMSVLGERLLAWNCADFSIDADFRTLGVAAKLRRVAKDGIDSRKYAFLYAHPNDRMLAVHLRVGHSVLGKMHRYARVISLGARLRQAAPIATVIAPATVLADGLLRFRDRQSASGGDVELEDHGNSPFDDEFTAFYEAIEPDHAVSGVRDAAYLNWRHFENPVQETYTLTARREGVLVGYLLYTIAGNMGVVTDAVVSDVGVLRPLFSFLALNLRTQRGITTVSFNVPEWSHHGEMLRRCGFRQRDDSSSSVVVYARSDDPATRTLVDAASWFMTVGDRDI